MTQPVSPTIFIPQPNQAIIMDRDGRVCGASEYPNEHMALYLSNNWRRRNIAASMTDDEASEIICKHLHLAVIWPDRTIGLISDHVARKLYQLADNGWYQGYLPIIVHFTHYVYNSALDQGTQHHDGNTEVCDTYVDIRPVLDTVDDMTLNAWLHPTSIDKPHSVAMARIISICIERYLVDTENPIKPAPENCTIETSMSLAQYAQRFRSTPATDDELQAARQRLDRLTYEATSRLINIINETRLPILKRLTDTQTSRDKRTPARTSLWLVIDQEAGGIIACTKTADEAYTIAQSWADAHYPDQPLENIEAMEVREIASGEILV